MLIGWHAGQISCPLERLRYLRGAARPAKSRSLAPSLRAGCGLVLLLIPLQSGAPVALPPLENSLDAGRPPVWLIEKNQDYEFYSNGLRIENRFAIDTPPRLYPVFESSRPDLDTSQWRSEPAGIVYHATESDQVPLEPEETARLRRTGEDLLDYVRRRQSYHFLVDRFGRVYRIAAESGTASHAGNSVWADRQWLYVNLNAAFLGVAFEARTGDGNARLEPAQVQSGRLLTALLRSRYAIRGENCITHAQVSINPRNNEIGYHTDWAVNFPYAAMGLADNYRLPVPSVSVFGFTYGPAFLEAAGGQPWAGLALAETVLRGEAAGRGFSVAGYERVLQKRYTRKIAALHSTGALEAISNEQQ